MGEWKECKLGDVAGVQNGYAFKSDAFNDCDGIPVVKIKNVASGKLDMRDVKYYQLSIKGLENFLLNKNDILITMTGSHIHQPSSIVGKVARYNIKQKALLNQRVGKVYSLNDRKLNEDYLYHFLSQEDVTYELALNAGGSANQANISPDLIKSLNFLLPPLPEQKTIAGILSSLDDKIDLLHRQNKTLEAMAEALFRQWFVEEAQNDWEKVKLGDILDTIETGSRPKGGIDPNLKDGIPSIGAESINGIGIYDFSKTKYIPREFFEKMCRGVVKSYDVLIYKDGAYVGRKGMFGNGFPFLEYVINEHIFILRTNAKANQIFLYFSLQEDDLAQLNSNSAQPGLNQQAMNLFEVVLPPEKLIKRFEQLTKQLIDKLFFNAHQIRTLEKLRDTLLPKLMSCEVRVTV